jgi:hypothetical protein
VTLTKTADGLAWVATVLAALAALAGIATPLYRDVAPMIDQARAADLATLLIAVPLLVVTLGSSRRGSARARVVAYGALGYLAYTYAIFSFQVVVNPLTVVHIAILGSAVWALLLHVPDMTGLRGIGRALPRRLTAAFLAVIAVMFAALWLGQIGSAITTGRLPGSVAELGLPTSAVYALDLAFVLPLLTAAAILLLRHPPAGYPLALGGLVFSVLMALSIVALFIIQASHDALADPTMAGVFGLIALGATTLAARGSMSSGGIVQVDARAPSPVG